MIDEEWAQVNLAKVKAGLHVLRLMNWKVAWTADGRHEAERGGRLDDQGLRDGVLSRRLPAS